MSGALEHVTGTLLDRRDRSSGTEGSGTYGSTKRKRGFNGKFRRWKGVERINIGKSVVLNQLLGGKPRKMPIR